MQLQTIFQAGNSDVVAIPKPILKEAGLRRGSKVTVKSTGEGLLIKRATSVNKVRPASQQEFKKWLNQVMDEDGQTLDELALR